MKIRLAEENDEQGIAKLLNEVTLYLHKKGINQWIYPWNMNLIQKDVENKHTYVIIYENKIIAVFSIKNIAVSQWFKDIDEEKPYLYRIAVAAEYQGKNIGKIIIDYAKRLSIDLGQPIYLDCWAGNQKLRDFYLTTGFKHCGDFHEEDYMISVFKYDYSEDVLQ